MTAKWDIIKTYIEDNRSDMLALWEKLVNTESGPRQEQGINDVIKILQQEMEQAGICSRVLPVKGAGNILVGEWNTNADSKPFLLIGHMDTVFPAGCVQHRPFCIDKQGNAHGPGVLDMKGGLVAALYTVKALSAIGWNKYPIKMVFAGDEETMHMSSDAKQILKAEMEGAIAAFNFETGYPNDALVVGRTGGGIVHITITGVSAHSGLEPQKGRSAILEAARIVMELESKNDNSRGKLINCGEIQGGIGENTIPDACSLRIGYRFPSNTIEWEILEDLEAAVSHHFVDGTQIKCEQKMHIDCMETTPDVDRLYRHVEETARMCGYGLVSEANVCGGSDSAISVSVGVPTICGMGVRGQYNHTEQEYAEVESLFERCYLSACSISGLDW